MPIELRCANCDQQFYCYPSDQRKFCSLACRSAYRFKKDIPLGRVPVEFICKECNKPFTMMQSYLTAYRKKFRHDPFYCSTYCSDTGRRKDADERNKFTCENCNKEFNRKRKTGGRIYREQKYCSHECKVEAQKKHAQHRFEAGLYKKHIKRNGYVWIVVPMLSRNGGTRSIMEHRYVMQQHLGRTLYDHETVHHVNGNRQDNRLENLELFSSRHGPGQRVIDKVQFAIDMLRLYPDFARAAGFELHQIAHVTDRFDSAAETRQAPAAPPDRQRNPDCPLSR